MDRKSSAPVENTGVMSRLVNYFANIILFMYYLVYFMFKGRDNAYSNDPAVCAVHRSPLQPVNKSTNVCCVHGVQTKTSSSTDNQNLKPPAKNKTEDTLTRKENDSLKPMLEDSHETTTPKSHTQLLKSKFEKLSEQAAMQQNGFWNTNEKMDQKPSSWLQKAYNYFGFQFSKPKALDVGDIKQKVSEESCSENGKITENFISPANGAPPKAPPPPQFPQPAFSRPRTDSVPKQTEIEPHYPLSLFADRTHMAELKEKLNSRAADLEQYKSQQNTSHVDVSVKQSSVASLPIYIKTKTSRLQDFTKTETEEEEEEEEPGDKIGKPIMQYAKPHVFYQAPQKAHLIIRTVYEDDHSKNVQITKKDWSSTTTDAPSQNLITKPEAQYANQTLTGSFSRPATLDNRIRPEEAPDFIHAHVLSKKNKFNEQLMEQVRKCKNISKELKCHQKQPPNGDVVHKTDVDIQISPTSRAQNMFLTRKNRMQKWVTSSAGGSNASQAGDKATDVEEASSSSSESSSCQSTDGKEHEVIDHLPKKLRNPFGEVHDFQNMSKEYGENLLTNIASPEKCHELSNVLSSDSKETEKSVELFHRRRHRAEQFVVNEKPSGTLPPMAPRKQINADDIIDAVKEAASRQESAFRPIIAPTSAVGSFSGQMSSQQYMRNSTDKSAGSAKQNLSGRQTPVWDHERLFSPVPFNPSSSSRSFTPVPVDFISGAGKQQPAANFSQQQPTSFYAYPPDSSGYRNTGSTLPKGWKSSSQV